MGPSVDTRVKVKCSVPVMPIETTLLPTRMTLERFRVKHEQFLIGVLETPPPTFAMGPSTSVTPTTEPFQ